MRRLGWSMLCLLVGLTGCGQTPPGSRSMEQLIIHEPQPMAARYQYEIAKINEALQSEDIEAIGEAGIARWLYRRGSLYDALGLTLLARYDFQLALEYQPQLADAYNYLGIHATAAQQFEEAFEAFEAALELQPEHPYAQLNRGITAYYAGLESLAVRDLQDYFALQPSDPYRSLWLFFAEHQQHPSLARQTLAQRRLQHADQQWGWRLVDLLLGVISEQKFLQYHLTRALEADETLIERLCEGYFYLGKLKQLEGDDAAAMVYFRLALNSQVFTFLEHRYAELELRRSEAMVQAQTPPHDAAEHPE